jgi:ornithine carbamoyltransferase
LTIAYVGDAANNMANSYLIGCALAGMNVRIGAPAAYAPDSSIVQRAETIASETGGSISVFGTPEQAISGSDVVATDTWISMGQETEKQKRIDAFKGYTIDGERMKLAKPDAIFLHCLPAYRGFEVSAEVIDGPQSVVWDEAENRLHAQKALMIWLSHESL